MTPGFPQPNPYERRPQPIISPLYAPAMPGVSYPPGGDIAPVPTFERAPLSQDIRWTSADQTDDAGGFYTLQVDQPTLVKVLQTTDDLAAPLERVDLDLFWKAFGEPGAEVSGFYGSAPAKEFYRNPFVGPYAYLPRAGSYEIYAVTGTSSGIRLPFKAQILQNFSPQEWLALLTSNGCRAKEIASGTLAAGGEALVPTQNYQCFPQFRSMIVDNTGANQLAIRIGNNTAAGITVAAGASFEITEAYLGRGTVALQSTAGTTFRVLLGLW